MSKAVRWGICAHLMTDQLLISREHLAAWATLRIQKGARVRLCLRHKRLCNLCTKKVPSCGPEGGAKQARINFCELLVKLCILEKGKH